MVDGDWLTSYQHLSDVGNALDRIDDRIRARMDDRIKLVDAISILERELIDLDLNLPTLHIAFSSIDISSKSHNHARLTKHER